MPNFHGVDLNDQKVDTTNLLRGKTTLMAFVFARFGEVILAYSGSRDTGLVALLKTG